MGEPRRLRTLFKEEMKSKEYILISEGKEHKISVEGDLEAFLVREDKEETRVKVLSLSENEIHFAIDAEKKSAFIAKSVENFFVSVDGIPFQFTDGDLIEKTFEAGQGASFTETEIKAPMPGKIVKIFVKEGETVEGGQKIAVLEAMKMENELLSPGKFKVSKILAKEGDLVDAQQKIVEFIPIPSHSD
jgi:biotin carboxyl carrier protein